MPTRCTYDGGGGRCVLRKEHKGAHSLGLHETKRTAQKFARYHGKPFECGSGVEYNPGWYTFEEGAFAATVQEYEPDPLHDYSQIEHELLNRRYTLLAPIERDA
jgi:hypothetical protein